MICFQRALETIRLFVGGPAQLRSANPHGQPPPLHVPAVGHSGAQMPSQGAGKVPLAQRAQTAAVWPYLTLGFRKATTRAFRIVENFDPVHAFAILTGRSSKRNGPLVLCHAGGNA